MFKNHGRVFKQKHKRCTCPTLKVNLYLFKTYVNDASYCLCLKQERFIFEIIEFNILFNKKTHLKQFSLFSTVSDAYAGLR